MHDATIVHIPHNCRLALTLMTLFPWKLVRHKAGNGSMKGGMDGGSSRRGIMRSWRRITLWARKSLKLWFVEICILLTFKPWNSVRRVFPTGREKSRETWRQVPVKESLDSRRGSGSSDYIVLIKEYCDLCPSSIMLLKNIVISVRLLVIVIHHAN